MPALAAGMATQVFAYSPGCGPRDDVLAQLAAKYNEQPTQQGLANNGGMIEVLTSDEGATWTIIVSTPNGTSCLLAAGEWWQKDMHLTAPVIGDGL